MKRRGKIVSVTSVGLVAVIAGTLGVWYVQERVDRSYDEAVEIMFDWLPYGTPKELFPDVVSIVATLRSSKSTTDVEFYDKDNNVLSLDDVYVVEIYYGKTKFWYIAYDEEMRVIGKPRDGI